MISEGKNYIPVSPKALMLKDEGYSFEEVARLKEKFTPYAFEKVKSGKNTYWIRLEVHNDSNKECLYYLGYSRFDYITFYVPDNHGIYKKYYGGQKELNTRKVIVNRNNSYAPVSLLAGAHKTIYLKCTYEDKPIFEFQSVPMDLSLEEESWLIAKRDERNNAFNIFMGAICIMALYNLALFLMVKEIGYLLYSLNALSMLFFNYVFSGKVVDLLESNAYYEQLLHWAGFSAIVFFILLSRVILRTSKYFPKLDKYLKWQCIFLILGCGLVLTENYFLITPMGTYLLASTYMILIYISFKKMLGGSLTAQYYLAANVLYFTALGVHTLQTFNIIPELFGMKSIGPLLLGGGLELAIFSLSLGARINETKDKLSKERLEKEVLKRKEEHKRMLLISEHNKDLEKKVKDRTLALVESQEELKQQNEELNQLNSEIQEANDKLTVFQRNITSSISYAERIQRAALPNEREVIENLDDSFILYLPRDVVSGDFYWSAKHGDKLFVAAVDCTGHGVPGAFMSLIAVQQLTDIVNVRRVEDPGMILKVLNERVRAVLHQDETNNQDGMDMALCVIDTTKKTLSFAGAKNPLLYIQDGEVNVIKGTKCSIGGELLKQVDVNYEATVISYKEKPITFYIYSDGYQDQFNPQGKKFMSKRFRQTLSDSHDIPMNYQKQELMLRLREWMGDESQIDDILVIGGRIS
ncbi:hypothetical protein GCM10023331_24320 [Algivirga pacifica]|uniref:PPM-type phosphatase domain-containing protein n=1 Tax=Algivirga pacifica TaxID=1162670 RepID=A0ABP9DB52_9BACT